MRIAFVHALEFHWWVLHDVAHAASSRHHDVGTWTHRPHGRHHWLDPNTLTGLSDWAPDVVIMADMPFGPVREVAPKAMIVTTRHSLAARGNTWHQDVAGADLVALWSERDAAEFRRRNIDVNGAIVGCPWVEPLFNWELPSKPLRTLLWAPTWNPELWCADVVVPALRELSRIGWRVVVRPHAATVWRAPEVVAEWWSYFEISEDMAPYADIARASVVLGDVSGIGLLANAAPDGVRPAVVQVDSGNRSLAQVDLDGPEWSTVPRLLVGATVDDVVASVETASKGRPAYAMDEWLGPCGSSVGAGARLIEAIERRHRER